MNDIAKQVEYGSDGPEWYTTAPRPVQGWPALVDQLTAERDEAIRNAESNWDSSQMWQRFAMQLYKACTAQLTQIEVDAVLSQYRELMAKSEL